MEATRRVSCCPAGFLTTECVAVFHNYQHLPDLVHNYQHLPDLGSQVFPFAFFFHGVWVLNTFIIN